VTPGEIYQSAVSDLPNGNRSRHLIRGYPHDPTVCILVCLNDRSEQARTWDYVNQNLAPTALQVGQRWLARNPGTDPAELEVLAPCRWLATMEFYVWPVRYRRADGTYLPRQDASERSILDVYRVVPGKRGRGPGHCPLCGYTCRVIFTGAECSTPDCPNFRG